MSTAALSPFHSVVSQQEWLQARLDLLTKEKDLRRHMDQVARQRHQLPWTRVEQNYIFDTAEGPQTLAGLFEGRSQLIVYHFMFGPDWEQGCPGCSFLADHLEGPRLHLPHRDVTLLAVSRAPLAKLEAFKKRMGWKFRWVSSAGSSFNFDYQAAFTDDQPESGQVYYNYGKQAFPQSEAPGLSVFFQNAGQVFHCYSTYARGLDVLVGAYNYLDLVPKGRDEASLTMPMAWVRHHDRYEDAPQVSPCGCPK